MLQEQPGGAYQTRIPVRKQDLYESCPLGLNSDAHFQEGPLSTKVFTFSRERVSFL